MHRLRLKHGANSPQVRSGCPGEFARLAAYAEGHGIGVVVTENVRDFAGLAAAGGFRVVRPVEAEPAGGGA